MIDADLVLAAQRSVRDRRFPRLDEFEEEEVEESKGSIGHAIVGELLAIFPGVIAHGVGHYYAGDRKTAKKLSRIGQFGYLLTAAGGGLGYLGYLADDEDAVPDGYAYTLYTSGGLVGGAGLAYFFTAWIYDMVDTPRAVLSGGRPPPRSRFVESLDIFGDGG